MAGKAKAMSQIKQLLRLHQQGDSIKSIARTLGISKNTVKSYLIKLATGKLAVAELLVLEDPVLESKFHAGNPAYKDPRFEHLSNNLESYCNPPFIYIVDDIPTPVIFPSLSLSIENIASLPSGS